MKATARHLQNTYELYKFGKRSWQELLAFNECHPCLRLPIYTTIFNLAYNYTRLYIY